MRFRPRTTAGCYGGAPSPDSVEPCSLLRAGRLAAEKGLPTSGSPLQILIIDCKL